MDAVSECGERTYRDDALTQRIIGCVIKVHRTLGPGFIESIYRNALAIEFRRQGIPFARERVVRVYCEGEQVGMHRLDFLVAGDVVLEWKTVDRLGHAYYAQLRSYLRATNRRRGLLVNFATERADCRRVEI